MIILTILLLIFVPGIFLASVLWHDRLPMVGFLALSGALGTAWSILLTFILAFLHVPFSFITLGIVSILPAVFCIIHGPSRSRLIYTTKNLPIFSWKSTLLYLLTIVLLAQPFFFVHNQLPTGDIQKAIYWGNNVLETGKLPNYSTAASLNRDPADFSTPALHTLTAAIIKLSGNQYTGPAWFSFVLGMILAGLSITITSLFTSNRNTQLLSLLFASLNIRFLRYVLYPGYHYQNLVGELLLILGFTLFLLFIKNRKGEKKETIPLLFSCFIILLLIPFVHQFTAFLTVFVSVAVIIIALIFYRSKLKNLFILNKKVSSSVLLLFLALTIILLFFSPLSQKLSVLFTFHPHLKPFAITITEYPSFFGSIIFFLGISGIIFFLFNQKKYSNKLPLFFLLTYAILFLFLGQGNFFFIDIPSARTLFFAALPLAVLAGLFVGNVVGKKSVFAAIVLVTVLALQANSASQQIIAVSHTPRVNATLTKETTNMIAFLNSFEKKGDFNNFLIDDWNRRRLTWGILSNFNMVTRIGGDLKTIGDEAKQSALRKSLYETNLDYEKIFMLGNSPVIGDLLRKYKIGLIGAAEEATSNNFKYNPLLGMAYGDSDTTIFSFNLTETVEQTDKETEFLLQPQTIANDVGDDEDIAPYSPISILATRISDPIFRDDRTYREIQSADGIIRLNVGTYVLPFWDSEGKTIIQKPVRLLLRIKNNGAGARMFFDNKKITNFETSKNGEFKDIIVDIPENTLSYNDKGFIDLKLQIQHGPLVIDLIAAGTVAK
jgi:hypothetical protein